MSIQPVFIAGWARSAVVARGGGFNTLQAHDIAAPVIQAMLARAGVARTSVEAVVLGNSLGAGGNPARMAVFAAGLSDTCATFSVDTLCCSGLDAINLGAGLIHSGQATVVVAGGVEAWSRSPIRQVRPLKPGDAPITYKRPPFCPDPARDPDLLISAAEYAWHQGYTRVQQDAYAVDSHHKAVANALTLTDEIVPVAGVRADTYPRVMTLDRAARLPVKVAAGPDLNHALTPLHISTQADGAALVLLVAANACDRMKLNPRLTLHSQATSGGNPTTPLLAAGIATRNVLNQAGIPDIQLLSTIELHDSFAAQGIGFCHEFGLTQQKINRRGGGLARGHPIAASGVISLVRVLADLSRDGTVGDTGLAAIAAAGGLGSAAIAKRC